MKAQLTFDLPEEERLLDAALKGQGLQFALKEFQEKLFHIKDEEDLGPLEQVLIERIWRMWRDETDGLVEF